MSRLFLKNFVTFLLRPRMATLQPAFAEATACQAEVLTTDRPTPSAFVPQSRDYGVIDFTDNADGIRRLVSFAEASGAREASKPVQLTPRADFLKRLPGSHSFELQHLGLAILPSSILYGNGSEIPIRNPKLQAKSEYQNRKAALASSARAVSYPPLLRRRTSRLRQDEGVPGRPRGLAGAESRDPSYKRSLITSHRSLMAATATHRQTSP